jgi:hypothetical protein
METYAGEGALAASYAVLAIRIPLAPPKLKLRTCYAVIRSATSPAQCGALYCYLLTASGGRGP